jgi:DNA primase
MDNRDIDLIKEKVNLVEFLKNYINLSPTGKNFKALCPFHQEKTPSFFVSPEKNIWHCFGCGLGGDVIKFVMLYEHLEFPEALKFLAEKAGLQISPITQREQKEFNTLYEIYKLGTEFYKNNLKKNEVALNYLKSRGLKDETIDFFDLGFSPEGDELTKFLLKNKYNINDIYKAGLTYKTSSGLFKDKFQNRIIFPIANQIGKVVAFTGRILQDGSNKITSDTPKYLNSPESLIFNKSKVLYGLDKAKQFINEEKTVIIVEGQMDFLMLWQSGFKNVVAISGTGLTEEHLVRLKSLADTVLVSFDKDDAGIKALERSLSYFYRFDFFVKVLDLKNFKDPAEVCQKSSQLMGEIIKNAKSALNYLIDIYIEEKKFFQLETPTKKNTIRHLLSLIGLLQNSVEKDEALKNLAEKTKIGENYLREELNSLLEGESENLKVLDWDTKINTQNQIDEIIKKLYVISLTNEKFSNIIKDEINSLPLEFKKLTETTLVSQKDLLELESDYLKTLWDQKILEKEFYGLLKKIKIINLKNKIQEIKNKIKKVEAEKNEELLSNLLAEFSNYRRQLDNLQKDF